MTQIQVATLFEYPAKASFGRILPKNKIYKNASLTVAQKDLFVQQVESIVWKYKLAPETINLPSTRSVQEIQIFHIALKQGELKKDVLRCIDKAIPLPIMFELYYGGKCKAIACYKRPNEADSSKWVISDYVETGWLTENTPRSAMPVALDLGKLYEALLSPLIPYPTMNNESMAQRMERIETIRAKQRELEKAESRLNREKQFNRKVEINAEIRAMQRDIERLATVGMVDNDMVAG
jgi:hypothetical protein